MLKKYLIVISILAISCLKADYDYQADYYSNSLAYPVSEITGDETRLSGRCNQNSDCGGGGCSALGICEY